MVRLGATFNPTRFMLPGYLTHFKPKYLARLLVLLISTTAVSCGDSTPFSSTSSVTLPYQTTIRDDQGRSLDIKLIYRTSDSIHFIRNSDQREFDLAITKLSREDQRWIKKIPATTAAARTAAERTNHNQIYIKNRQKAIDRLDAEIQELADKIASGTLNSSQFSHNNRQMERKRAEILKIEAQIEDYQNH